MKLINIYLNKKDSLGMIYLELLYKRPSKEARMAMCNAAMSIDHAAGRTEYIRTAEDSVSNITGHKHVKIVNSGNSAILSVMSTFNNKILIPDQGGWIGFKNIAKFLGIEALLVPTNLGIIDPDVLINIIEDKNPEALFLTSFAGYIGEQSIKQIYKTCNENGVTLVEDASGAVGDKKKRLANGNHAHVILASTGYPKIINVGNGGFISTDDNKILKSAKTILKIVKADSITCAGISAEIKNASQTLSGTVKACKFLKKELEYSIHKDKRGITIALPVNDPQKVGYELRKKLNVEGRNIITICPRYERINANAVCVEIKNLDLRCLKLENLEEIVQIIKETI